ncbi:PilZ domain-containing protein [Candidatus Omnitrophota bacterium]
MLNKKISKEELREYKRLDTIFPVEIQLLNKDLQPASNWHQAFSQDISTGGICLTINDLSQEESLNLKHHETNLFIQIHSPVSDRCFLAYAKLVWFRKIQDEPFVQFVVGLNFTKVDAREVRRLLNYVLFKKILWRSLQFLILGALAFLIITVTSNFRLNTRNLILINQYSQLLRQDLGLKEDYKKLLNEREELTQVLKNRGLETAILEESIKKTEDSRDREIEISEKELLEVKKRVIESEEDEIYIKELKKSRDEESEELRQKVVKLQEEDKKIKGQLAEIIAKESEMKEEFQIVEQEKVQLSESFKGQLYNWLRAHQNKRKGLVESFEGDRNLKGVAYIYDQSLATIAYTLFGDYDNAKRGLDFFLYKAERTQRGGFYNAYYSSAGAVSEYTAHAGPNLWVGIAIIQYTYKSRDYSYLRVAEQIAEWIKSLQDEEGGIRGGEDLAWHSTEHNLDGFAFFNMFYELTKDERYKDIADKILGWLKEYAYGNEYVPVNRGKGDSTIATDTYAWSIAALGPERLNKAGVDTDEILEFAVENCLVETEFTDRFSKIITVSGFDFAKHQHLARGGVVSCEWTAQMILSFNIMADYYFQKVQLKKATYYQNEITKYLNELSKMVVSSPSAFGQGAWCMPYASHQNVDTGHGWRTPRGNRTGSVAATAYTIFAISKFNPLELSE